MRTSGRLRNWLLFPTRTRRRAIVSAILLVAIGYLTWYGVRIIRANRAYSAGEEALAAYDFPTAREQFKKCTQLRPKQPKAWLLAAQAARRDGDLVEARAFLGRYEALVGKSTPEARLEGLLQRIQLGQYEQDIQYLISLADTRHPAAEQIMEALAVGCIYVYHLDRASFWVQQLHMHFPKNPTGRLIRAQLDDILGKREQAANVCRELLIDFPNHTQARLLLAALLFKAQNYAEAVGEYEELRRRRPADVEPLLGLARCLERLGRLDEARPLMQELEERHADNSEALLECGRFAVRENRLADAERLLRRAVQLAPSDHIIHYHLGLCLEQLGKTNEAQQHLARFKQIEADLVRMQQLLEAIVKTPLDPTPRREAGLICLRNGQNTEGLRWLQGALELAPNDKATHEALADYFLAQGDLERSKYHRLKAQ
ncbi:MAG: tetratricopeptide repeat protein [Planctomycetia bacterium]|nr:tetratricopeptide repeat protein [Planctomycetia bacterium]